MAAWGLDDKDVWECRSLTKDDHGHALWKLERDEKGELAGLVADGTAKNSRATAQDEDAYVLAEGDNQWVWRYYGKLQSPGREAQQVPQITSLPEEPLTGYWERLLLSLTRGQVDVWKLAEKAA